METTLNAIRDKGPCADGWSKLLRNLGKTRADDEPLSLLAVLDSNGFDDALWCLKAVVGYDKEIRLFAVWCARQVQHLMTDQRSINAVDVAERVAHGEASEGELIAARTAALAAAWDAAARAAARAAALAARAAAGAAHDATGDAAWDAAWAAARDAAWAAAWDAAWAAARDAAWAAAWDAAWAAAWDAARDAARALQEEKFRELISG